MNLMGTGHAACVVGDDTLVIFDPEGFAARGGDPKAGDYVAEHGVLRDVPDEVGERLLAVGLAIRMADPEPTADAKGKKAAKEAKPDEKTDEE